MQGPHRTDPVAVEVVALDAVAGPVHGQGALEGDRRGGLRPVRPYQPELPVHRQQHLVPRGPAHRYGGHVAVDRHGLAVHDEGAGPVAGRGRAGGPQIGEPPGRGERRGHHLRLRALRVLGLDRAPAVGRHGRDRTGVQRGLGGLRPYEQQPRAVRRPGRVEVLPRAVLQRTVLAREPRDLPQRAGPHVGHPYAVRAARHRVAGPLGGERDAGAVG